MVWSQIYDPMNNMWLSTLLGAIPIVVLLGGIGLGLLLALVSRLLVSWTANRRARVADKRLRDAISEVSAEMVVEPIRAELVSYGEVRDGLGAALR